MGDLDEVEDDEAGDGDPHLVIQPGSGRQAEGLGQQRGTMLTVQLSADLAHPSREEEVVPGHSRHHRSPNTSPFFLGRTTIDLIRLERTSHFSSACLLGYIAR